MFGHMYQHYISVTMHGWLLLLYVVMVFPVFIVLFFIVWTVHIVIYCDLLCYLVYRPRGCIKLDLKRAASSHGEKVIKE